jgi:cell wall-associated NlpC family hydrolase
MLKKVLLTAFFAVSFGITQAYTNASHVLVTVNTKAVGSTTKSAALNKRNSIVSDVINFASKHLSIRYRAGGTTPKGFDCSGFTRFCFSKFGIDLPHSSAAQGSVGQKVEQKSARPGDLIFFKGHSADGDAIGHVGLITDVVGKQIKFIHSAWGGGIRFDHLHTSYYRNRFVGIRRVARLMAER